MRYPKPYLLFYLVVVCQCFQISATEYQPWLGNLYEFESQTTLNYQGYRRVSIGTQSKNYKAENTFIQASFVANFLDGALELEAIEANTKRQRGDLDHLKLTFRSVLQNDIAGDERSVTVGVSYIQAFNRSLKDFSSFHHGQEEGEFFLSIGREKAFEALWSSRWWSLLGMGIANQGSPWLRFNLAYEVRLREKHEVKFLMNSLWGMGQHKLNLFHFKGYGSIQHQSVDVGVAYTYLLDYFGSLRLGYMYRLHARNFPLNTHQIIAQLHYQFGL